MQNSKSLASYSILNIVPLFAYFPGPDNRGYNELQNLYNSQTKPESH